MDQLQQTRIRRKTGRRGAVIAGLLLAALGAAALAVASGQAFRLAGGRPGPGFAPVLIAAAMVTLGLLHALLGRGGEAAPGRVRPGLVLAAAVAAFALLLPPAGFVPAAWAAGSLALAAAPGLGMLRVIAGGGGIAVAAGLLFLVGLGLATPAFGPR